MLLFVGTSGMDGNPNSEQPDDFAPLDRRALERYRRVAPSARRTVAKPAARRIGAIAAALDGFCARMNDGLAAVALVLALGLTVSTMVRHPETFLPAQDAETTLAAEDILLTP